MNQRTAKTALTRWFCCGVLLGLASSVQSAHAVESEMALNRDAHRVLESFCYRCHGVTQKVPDFDVLDRESLTKGRGSDGGSPFVVPGDADSSEMWHFMEGDDAYMPLTGSPEADKMTAADRETLRRWIDAGAHFPERVQRPLRKPADDLEAIRDYLLDLDPDARRNTRFFTLSHLSNHNARYSEQDLRLVRAAVAKLINSLSWQDAIVVPEIVPNSQDTVLAIDLRDLKWTGGNHWLQIINHYPYGLKFNYVPDQRLKQVADDVQQLSGAEMAVIRADWFVFNAAQGTLYHDLLGLPNHVDELERMVGVDVKENILSGNAARSAFGRSGVSRQNRMVERHDSKYGAYWISYDFLPRRGRGDLIRFPLGPRFDGNRFNRLAFSHDGGEAIFHLPNGLQGYFLVTAEGDRLDGPAPADVVFDSAAIAGTPAIVNGISCMNCHREGMITGFRDEIRDSDALAGAPLEKVRQLYVPAEQMERLVERDRTQFLTALRATIGPFLLVAEDAHKSVTDFPEPIGRVAQNYLADLGPSDVAFELGLASLDEIESQIKHDRDLRKLGLGTLIQEKPGTIKRVRWEAIDGTSFFQDVAVELSLGTPILPGTQHNFQRLINAPGN